MNLKLANADKNFASHSYFLKKMNGNFKVIANNPDKKGYTYNEGTGELSLQG